MAFEVFFAPFAVVFFFPFDRELRWAWGAVRSHYARQWALTSVLREKPRQLSFAMFGLYLLLGC
jgi:hypothetical protein